MRALPLFLLIPTFGCDSDRTGADASADGTTNSEGSKRDGATDGGAHATSGDANGDTPNDAVADSPPVEAGPGVYTAYGVAGGYDHVAVIKAVGSTCFVIGLRSPDNTGAGLTLPASWGFEYARAMQPAQACSPYYMGPITNTFDATSQSGTIAWNGTGIPMSISSMSVTLGFAMNPMWCPPSETLAAMNIQVQ